ncbi:MAG: DNA-binding protein [Nitrospiraceae bacterium]|nr:MAG: DNA-binding protein [Nitrospiraceae bacterium]
MLKSIKPSKMYMGKLSHGSDLLEEITDLCIEKNIKLGRVEGIGAVQKARIGYYNQAVREYQYIELDHALEITKLIGNISLKDKAPFVHAHITLSDKKGNAFGGHLAQGTLIYACEIMLQSFEGPELTRSYDEVTGLPLWL